MGEFPRRGAQPFDPASSLARISLGRLSRAAAMRTWAFPSSPRGLRRILVDIRVGRGRLTILVTILSFSAGRGFFWMPFGEARVLWGPPWLSWAV